MTSGLGHEQAFAELGAVALDALDPTTQAAVLAHVVDCDACRAELDSLRAAAASLAFVAPAAADSTNDSRARIRERLMARATANGQARRLANPPLVFPKSTGEPSQAAAPSRRRIPGWIALAAGVLFVVSLGLLAAVFRDREAVRATLAQQTAKGDRARHAADSLQAVLASRDSLIAGLTGRDVSMMTLTSRGAKDPYARMFWDRTRNTWTLFARNMPTLKAGRTYQVWLVTAKATVSAGTFDAQNGVGVLRATYAVTPENLKAVAVTEEPAGGVPLPTGDTIIAITTGK